MVVRRAGHQAHGGGLIIMLDELRLYIYITVGTLSIGSMVYSWLTARSQVNASEIDNIKAAMASAADVAELRKRDAAHDNRLARLETQINHVASAMPEIRNEIGQVHRRLDDLSGAVHEIGGTLKAVAETDRMVLKHLLGSDGK